MALSVVGVSLGGFIATAAPASAQALNCTYGFSNISFGNVDLSSGLAADSTGTMSVNCQGAANQTARICPNLGEGTGGSTGSGSPRKMISGTNYILFSLYSDPARATVWGSWVWPWTASFPAPQLDIPLGATGRATGNYTIYARVLAGQTAVPAGSYASSFSGGHTLISSAYSNAGSCAAIGATNGVQVSFTTTATVVRTCGVTTTALDFGTLGSLSAIIDGASQLRVTCTIGTPYTIGLGGGVANATSPTQRKMTRLTSTITYGLYGDAARTQGWFNTGAFYQASGTANGLAQTYNIYGRIPVQTTPPIGVYTDTVVVTVTY